MLPHTLMLKIHIVALSSTKLLQLKKLWKNNAGDNIWKGEING